MGCSSLPMMPRNMKQIALDEQFAFSCHQGVSCFTECCRMLELALSPYDVLRLRRGLGLLSREVLDRYVIKEFDNDDIFPRYYLTMVDDGRASCVFVDTDGCQVYRDRPGACRAYPLGRAAVRNKDDNKLSEEFILIKEEHCLGFAEQYTQTPTEYSQAQGLTEYNTFTDALGKLLMHPKLASGFRPTQEQRDLFHLALYDIDSFREQLFAGDISLDDMACPNSDIDDEQLLLFSVDWLIHSFFS